MNLRDGNDFSAQDRVPSKILTDFPRTEEQYRLACYSFFTALFETLEEHLSTFLASDDVEADITRWAEQMCSVGYPPRFTTRGEFFTKVAATYLKVRIDLLGSVFV